MFVNQVSGTQSDRHALRFETDLEISQQTEWTLFSLFIQAPRTFGRGPASDENSSNDSKGQSSVL